MKLGGDSVGDILGVGLRFEQGGLRMPGTNGEKSFGIIFGGIKSIESEIHLRPTQTTPTAPPHIL